MRMHNILSCNVLSITFLTLAGCVKAHKWAGLWFCYTHRPHVAIPHTVFTHSSTMRKEEFTSLCWDYIYAHRKRPNYRNHHNIQCSWLTKRCRFSWALRPQALLRINPSCKQRSAPVLSSDRGSHLDDRLKDYREVYISMVNVQSMTRRHGLTQIFLDNERNERQ